MDWFSTRFRRWTKVTGSFSGTQTTCRPNFSLAVVRRPIHFVHVIFFGLLPTVTQSP